MPLRSIRTAAGPALAALVFGAAAVLVATGAIDTGGDPGALPWIAGGMAVLMLALAIAAPLASRRTDSSRSAWAAAAAAHGFAYRGRVAGPGIPGLVFRTGENVVAHDVVDALESATPFLAGTVTGTYATDGSLPRVVASSFVALPLPREVPNLVLLGTGIGVLRLAGVAIGGRQRLPLEGDFDRTFSLYCPEGYERDALYIFSPDLMALLVDATGGCDVELVDGWMLIHAGPRRFATAEALDRIVAATELVQGKLRRQTERYADERSAAPAAPGATRTVSPAEHAAARQVAEAGRRVRTRASVLQTVVTVVTTAVLVIAAAWWLVTRLLPV